MSLNFEYILTEVEVYSVVPQEQQTEDAVVLVDIGDIEVRVTGDVADVHGCMCAVSNFRSAAHTPQLQCQLGLQCECSQFGYRCEGRADEVCRAASVNHRQGFAAIDFRAHHEACAQFGGDQRSRTRGARKGIHTHCVSERAISRPCCWPHCHHSRTRPIG